MLHVHISAATAGADAAFDALQLWQYSEVLGQQAGRLKTRDARTALCRAYSALGQLLPEIAETAALLSGT